MKPKVIMCYIRIIKFTGCVVPKIVKMKNMASNGFRFINKFTHKLKHNNYSRYLMIIHQ